MTQNSRSRSRSPAAASASTPPTAAALIGPAPSIDHTMGPKPVYCQDRILKMLSVKALNGLHWDEWEGNPYTMQEFLANVDLWNKYKPDDIKKLQSWDQDPGLVLSAYFFCPRRMRDILERHGVNMPVEEFIRLSCEETFPDGSNLKAAIDEAYGPQNL